MAAVAVEKLQVAVGEFNPLIVGAVGGEVVQHAPRGDDVGHLALGAHEELAERVRAILGVAAVGAEHEMEVALP